MEANQQIFYNSLSMQQQQMLMGMPAEQQTFEYNNWLQMQHQLQQQQQIIAQQQVPQQQEESYLNSAQMDALDEQFLYYYDILADEFCEETDSGDIVPTEEIVEIMQAVEEEEEPTYSSKSVNQQSEKSQVTGCFEKSQNIEEISKKKEERNFNLGRWMTEEHDLFLEALRINGKDWNKMEEHIQTRDAAHCRSHAQKFFTKLIKFLDSGGHKEEMPAIDDAKIYLEILQRKIEKPNKKKIKEEKTQLLKKQKQAKEAEDRAAFQAQIAELEAQAQQENIFTVTKDPEAVVKRNAFLNIQPSNMVSEIIDENHITRQQQLNKEKEFMNWRKTGSVGGSQAGSIVNRRMSKKSNVSNTSMSSFNNALQKATQMMEKNHRNRDSFASDNSMGLSNNLLMKSQGALRQSIGSTNSDMINKIQPLQQPSGMLNMNEMSFGGNQLNQQQIIGQQQPNLQQPVIQQPQSPIFGGQPQMMMQQPAGIINPQQQQMYLQQQQQALLLAQQQQQQAQQQQQQKQPPKRSGIKMNIRQADSTPQPMFGQQQIPPMHGLLGMPNMPGGGMNHPNMMLGGGQPQMPKQPGMPQPGMQHPMIPGQAQNMIQFNTYNTFNYPNQTNNQTHIGQNSQQQQYNMQQQQQLFQQQQQQKHSRQQ